jgi:hypothetical protein
VIGVDNLNLFAMNLGALKKYPDTHYLNYADVENTGGETNGWPKVENSELKLATFWQEFDGSHKSLGSNEISDADLDALVTTENFEEFEFEKKWNFLSYAISKPWGRKFEKLMEGNNATELKNVSQHLSTSKVRIYFNRQAANDTIMEVHTNLCSSPNLESSRCPNVLEFDIKNTANLSEITFASQKTLERQEFDLATRKTPYDLIDPDSGIYTQANIAGYQGLTEERIIYYSYANQHRFKSWDPIQGLTVYYRIQNFKFSMERAAAKLAIDNEESYTFAPLRYTTVSDKIQESFLSQEKIGPNAMVLTNDSPTQSDAYWLMNLLTIEGASDFNRTMHYKVIDSVIFGWFDYDAGSGDEKPNFLTFYGVYDLANDGFHGRFFLKSGEQNGYFISRKVQAGNSVEKVCFRFQTPARSCFGNSSDGMGIFVKKIVEDALDSGCPNV